MKVAWLIVAYLVCIGVNSMDTFDKKRVDKDIEKAMEMGEQKEEETEEKDKQKQKDGVDNNKKTPESQLTMFASPVDEAMKMAKEASIQLAALKKLMSMENLDTHTLKVDKRYLRLWKKKFRKYCPTTYSGPSCDTNAYYRTIDGTCNNIKNPKWGAAMSPQSREIPPMYDDGIDDPRARGRNGDNLTSARVISNGVHSVKGRSPRNEKLTMMVMQWGQFIDHDLVSTPVLKGEMGSTIECCGEDNENRAQCFPIRIPDDDPHFNKTCMGFVRSAPVLDHDCAPGHREQLNQVTSYIDGSAVYGSKPNDTKILRRMKGGLLKAILPPDSQRGGMLPKDSDDKCTLETDDYCQRAGDVRVNVVPSLGWSHTCFMREHNRIAKILAEYNPHWDDETLFQQTRRIVIATEQIINNKEYLAAILNEETMKKYKLNLWKKRFRRCYNEKTNPTIANSFAAASFRFGHSQIANYQGTMNKQYEFVETKPIESTYHRPHMILYENGMAQDGVARWLIGDKVPLADGLFEEGVQNKLFQDKKGNALDLPALNIQRGRDHGLPAYNHWRVHCGFEQKASMADGGGFILPDHDDIETRKLEKVYSHVDDIDLFTGAMTETLLPNSSVGPTFACMIGEQFRKLMTGDRYWHETNDKRIRFTKGQLKELRKITFARVMCDNFRIDTIQPDVFRVPGPGNERVECNKLPEIDLKKWTACEQLLPDGRPNFSKKCSRKNKG